VRIAVLFDDVASRPGATPDEVGVLEAVSAVGEALATLGHEVIQVPAGEDVEGWRSELQGRGVGLVFNLCEGLGGRNEGEVTAARAVEEMGLPLTGNRSRTLALARRKDEVNTLLQERGLPVPPWRVWIGPGGGSEEAAAFAGDWEVYPAIVKPVAEDGSVGIDHGAVVLNPESLSGRLREHGARAPLLVQAFVGTREVNAGILGHEVLPLSEILFDQLPEGHPPIVGYRAKWESGSPEDRGTRPVCPAPLPVALAGKIRLLALKAWRAVGGCGYGRVDFRITPPDMVHVLEVNPNPDLSPSAGLARAAMAEGVNYRDLVRRIVQGAAG